MRRASSYQSNQNTERSLISRLLHACVREQLLSYTIRDGSLLIPLKHNQTTLLAKEVQVFNLGKLKIAGDPILITQDRFIPVRDINQLLELIHDEIKETVDAQQWEHFVQEINNCTVNAALVTSFVHNKNDQLSRQAASHKHFIDYVSAHYNVEEQLQFYEAWAAKGHPYHPCHKTKLGFSTIAYLKYSPEFNQDIDLPIAAIKKSLIHIESEDEAFEYNSWFAAQFPEQWIAWQAKLRSKKLNVDDYCPLFIHPWQYENVLTKLFQPLINLKHLQLFKDIVIKSKASLSFRTLIAKANRKQPHIKLPVAVHSTSALRTISPASVQNGPKLGKILKKIFAQENYFGHRIQLAYESCGLHINYPNPDLAKHLGIIYRQNPATFVKENEAPIVIAALFEESPITRLPFFIEILQAAVGKDLKGAKAYFDRYCNVVVSAYFDLFLIYGIALEGHQQNTLAVFENYLPKYMIARDLGGLRVHGPTLKDHGFDYKPHPNSATISNDSKEVTNKFLHTVIQYHLGELILLLAQHYQCAENIFWQILRNNLAARFDYLKDRVSTERWQQEYDVILNADWQIKGLMRMRLNNVYNKYIYISHKNPLRDT